MVNFVNRTEELTELGRLRERPGAQFVIVYGRRRVGKTTLLITWARQTELPVFYWVAKRDPKEMLMTNLAQSIYAWEHGLDYTDVALRPRDWEEVLRMLARAVGERQAIVILDEVPYILEQDAGFGSHLQAAWDHLFKDSNVLLFLSGSHIGMLTQLTEYQAPLYGRLTAQFPLLPLGYGDIGDFLANYNIYRQLAVYAIVGGVPAYLERWDDRESVRANVERLFLQRTGWFRNEPLVLISDLTQRETAKFEAVLKAIASGHHARADIATFSSIPSTSLSRYLPRLMELKLVERRVPATVPLAELETSRQSRYYLSDPFLRFYYRFIDPDLHLIESGLSQNLWRKIEEGFRAFVAYNFEDLCREWVLHEAQAGRLPFAPENVGQHWSTTVQVDVTAISWREREILLGECKWGDRPFARKLIRELSERKTPRLLADLPDGGAGWRIHYAFFARSEFTDAALALAAAQGAQTLTLADVEQTLAAS
jgi:uncharacterized protein